MKIINVELFSILIKQMINKMQLMDLHLLYIHQLILLCYKILIYLKIKLYKLIIIIDYQFKIIYSQLIEYGNII